MLNKSLQEIAEAARWQTCDASKLYMPGVDKAAEHQHFTYLQKNNNKYNLLTESCRPIVFQPGKKWKTSQCPGEWGV